jgi:uncharacterized protein (DUF427 family)
MGFGTRRCPPTPASCKQGWLSRGRPWTPSTKKTNGSLATPPTAATASTSGGPAATCSSACGDCVVADSARPSVLYESGFAPRWYVPRADIEESALTPVEGQTFCPYKGLASYYDISEALRAAWSYQNAWTEVVRICGLVSFEPDKVAVYLDGVQLRQEPGQSVISHGIDRDLTVSRQSPARLPRPPRASPAKSPSGRCTS